MPGSVEVDPTSLPELPKPSRTPGNHEGAWVAVTPHGVLPRDSHEISRTKGGGTQVDDFTRGFIKGKFTKHIRRRNGGGQGDPDPLIS